MNICAVIVAGGRSSRMGREKAFELVQGRSILERVVENVRGQVASVAINANGDTERFGALGFPVFGDFREAGTPLAGMHAALHFARAQGFDAVLTVPSDTPFLPSNLVRRLAEAMKPAATAASGGQVHHLTGLWSHMLLEKAAMALAQPRLLRLQDWAKQCGAAIVEWPVVPYDPFFNVNTPGELAEAERIAEEFGL